ncbi:hypothetical protein [Mycobacterium avium]|uniref:hypothetical protein n=1 Tax=Mycobacterium avium TaxID=1764 RepID=UPI001CC36DC2|nr:hypothetical protein [Mycobacterium avium]
MRADRWEGGDAAQLAAFPDCPMTTRPNPGRDQPPAWLVLAATWLLIFTAVYAALWVYF